ncbi:E3 SUMO-protein ligase ZBED1-like [Bufo gargarizans]|uniref:E3 SUMO-protein ligase ZBED1-like n=1 Tax=Bufo gargarizans TaxID=30331 RepID=UPI001CF5B0B6|nr:E3 SUMO-protein ligase ZBED1-like [Bufo gargarizans]
MAEVEQKEREIKNAPSFLKANIWEHFGFYEKSRKHELDKSYAVCKICHTKIKYLGNTTNLRNHVSRFHPEMLKPTTTTTTKEMNPDQPRIDAMLQSTLPPNSEKVKRITKAVAAFIAKDLRPYSVVENSGFRYLLKTIEPRYKIPSRSHFTENVIPALYHETKAKIIASMSQASRVAITCDSWTSVTTESYVTITAHYVSFLAEYSRISTFFHRSTRASHCLKEKQKCLGLKNHKLITDVATRWNSAYDMVERFLEQQPAVCATLLSPEVRRGESDLCTLNETDVSNAEDAVSALKPMKDATMLMSEERNPTVSLIAPINAQLLQSMTDTMGDTPMIHEIKNSIRTDLQKRYSSEAEKKILHTASALDPRFKGLPFILTDEERLEIFKGVTEEAASLEITSDESERTQEDHQVPRRKQTLEEEDSSPIEDNHSESPPSPPKKARSLLVSLLGQSFTDTEGTIEPKKTPYAKAEEEMENYCKAPPLPLTEDPLNWWREHEVIFPLLSRLSKQYLCIPGTSVSAERVFSTAGDVIQLKMYSVKDFPASSNGGMAWLQLMYRGRVLAECSVQVDNLLNTPHICCVCISPGLFSIIAEWMADLGDTKKEDVAD